MDVGNKENDLSDETLWNCLTETLVEMKELIVGYLPQFDVSIRYVLLDSGVLLDTAVATRL